MTMPVESWRKCVGPRTRSNSRTAPVFSESEGQAAMSLHHATTPTSTAVVDVPTILPRDAMHKRGLCRRAVSVRLASVTFVYCVETAKDTAIIAMEWEYETVLKLLSGTLSMTLNDLERLSEICNDTKHCWSHCDS